MNWFLALDTSSPSLFIGLTNGADLIERKIEIPQSHSQYLSQTVKDIISEQSITSRDINGVIIGKGPGSFTGLRIGFSFAKGFALALKIPVYTVSSLRAHAAEYFGLGRVVVPYLDARRGEIFASCFESRLDEEPIAHFEDEIIPVKDIKNVVASLSVDKEIFFVSAGELLIENTHMPKSVCASLFSLHSTKGEAYRSISDLSAFKPNYVRQVSAKTISERISIDMAHKTAVS